MEIAKQHHLPLVHEPPDQTFGREYRRMQPAARVVPLPIQIHPRQITPITPIHHPINIKHRHHLKHELRTQQPRQFRRSGQEVYQPLKHLAGVCLTRVHAGG